MPAECAAKSADELALLRTVVADLSDNVALSVYTDWLEDHGDPRGPFLREFLRAFDAGEPIPEIPKTFSGAWADALALPLRRNLRHGHEPKPGERPRGPAGMRPRGYTALEPVFAEILRTAVPAIRFDLGDVIDGDAPLGVTRAGGAPDVPADSPESDEVWAAGFLMQVNLADLEGTLAEGMLPEAGLLLFRLDFDSGRHVVFVPPGTPLRRIPYVADGEEKTHSRSVRLADDIRHVAEPEGLPRDNAYYSVVGGGRGHRLCTWLSPHNLPANYEYNGGGELDPAVFFELANFDEDRSMNWYFHDGDDLHVFAPADDARAGRFDRAYVYDAT